MADNGNGRLDGDLEAGATDSSRQSQAQAGTTPRQLNAIANGVRQGNRVHVNGNGGLDEDLEAGARYSPSQDQAGSTPPRTVTNQYQHLQRVVSVGAAGGRVEDVSNSDASNGATTNRDESVAVMRAAASTANMRTAFGQWRGVASNDAVRKSLSELAFRLEDYESEEDEAETAKRNENNKAAAKNNAAATNVKTSSVNNKVDQSKNGSSIVEFGARRVKTNNYNPLDRPQLEDVDLSHFALLLGRTPPTPRTAAQQLIFVENNSPANRPENVFRMDDLFGASLTAGGGQAPAGDVNSISASGISPSASTRGTPPGQ